MSELAEAIEQVSKLRGCTKTNQHHYYEAVLKSIEDKLRSVYSGEHENIDEPEREGKCCNEPKILTSPDNTHWCQSCRKQVASPPLKPGQDDKTDWFKSLLEEKRKQFLLYYNNSVPDEDKNYWHGQIGLLDDVLSEYDKCHFVAPPPLKPLSEDQVLDDKLNGRGLFYDFPENKPLYKDSGLWQLRTDDMEDVLVEQKVNEPFKSFIERCKKEGGNNA